MTPIDYGWNAKCGNCGDVANRHQNKKPHTCSVNTPTGPCKCPGFEPPLHNKELR